MDFSKWRDMFEDRDKFGKRVIDVGWYGYVWIEEKGDDKHAVGDMSVSALHYHLVTKRPEPKVDVRIEELHIGQEVDVMQDDLTWKRANVTGLHIGGPVYCGPGRHEPSEWQIQVNGINYRPNRVRLLSVVPEDACRAMRGGKRIVFTSGNDGVEFYEGEEVEIRDWDDAGTRSKEWTAGWFVQLGEYQLTNRKGRQLKAAPVTLGGYPVRKKQAAPKVVFRNDKGEEFREGEEVEIKSTAYSDAWIDGYVFDSATHDHEWLLTVKDKRGQKVRGYLRQDQVRKKHNADYRTLPDEDLVRAKTMAEREKLVAGRRDVPAIDLSMKECRTAQGDPPLDARPSQEWEDAIRAEEARRQDAEIMRRVNSPPTPEAVEKLKKVAAEVHGIKPNAGPLPVDPSENIEDVPEEEIPALTALLSTPPIDPKVKEVYDFFWKTFQEKGKQADAFWAALRDIYAVRKPDRIKIIEALANAANAGQQSKLGRKLIELAQRYQVTVNAGANDIVIRLSKPGEDPFNEVEVEETLPEYIFPYGKEQDGVFLAVLSRLEDRFPK